MKRVIYKFAASAVMVMCAARGAQVAVAAGEGQEQSAQASHNRLDDINRWKELVVTAAFVDVDAETVTLRGLNFGKKSPTVFCETDKMKVLSWSDTEIVVRFPKAVEDGNYLFTVARGNLDFERSAFYVTKGVSGGGGAGGVPRVLQGRKVLRGLPVPRVTPGWPVRPGLRVRPGRRVRLAPRARLGRRVLLVRRVLLARRAPRVRRVRRDFRGCRAPLARRARLGCLVLKGRQDLRVRLVDSLATRSWGRTPHFPASQ